MRLPLLLTAMLAVGCHDVGPPDDGVPETTAAGDETTGGTSTGGDLPVESAVCEAFLDCLEVVDPELFGSAFLRYGPGGSCFDHDGPAACEEACEGGLLAMHDLHAEEPACRAMPDATDG